MLIRKLQLLTDDLIGTAEFYHELLGLNIQEETEENLSLTVGHSVLQFYRSYGQRPQYHVAFTIPCNQIEEALTWMKGRAAVLDIEGMGPIADFRNWNAKAFYFLDNKENVLEFIARNDLKNESPVPFDSPSILSISEIGIVGEDVPQVCRALTEKHGIMYFLKQPPLPRFAAMGDDTGLLIVVPNKRDWYPTHIPSSKHWVRVEMVIDGKQHVLEQYTRPK